MTRSRVRPPDGEELEKYRVVTWALDPFERKLVGYYADLGAAYEAVLFSISSRTGRRTGVGWCGSCYLGHMWE